jgi:excinuclease ABC subunit A
VRKLLEVLHRLADLGNSIVIIEHNLDVIRNADWILDLGPEGGEDGGRIVGEGRPAKIAATPGSYTGEFLRRYYTSANGQLEPFELDDESAINGSSLEEAEQAKEPAVMDEPQTVGTSGAEPVPEETNPAKPAARKRTAAKKTAPRKSATRRKKTVQP